MRLWTVHPKYLDTKGLLAAWREGLLAQKVLQGATKGYRNHPQLTRFKSSPDPVGAIAAYLRGVYEEASGRGYKFGADKISPAEFGGELPCTRGQLLYEWNHLKEKLRTRDVKKYGEVCGVAEPEAHPLFEIVEGEVEAWEITEPRSRRTEHPKQ
ncbi:MAG TPA: pyrimidine dimer DNA glycosylase/endonuclease V [Pyrinomonadaceae bacterium]|nr:pyrimidine dimer DNA glycosylase/endonuclease V [Pyrinomonadaceae bacterium]